MDVKLHPDIGSAVTELKASGMQILATPPPDSSGGLSRHRLHQTHRHPGGQEKHGIGEEALAWPITISSSPWWAWCSPSTSRWPPPPSLYEAQRQRELAGCYRRGCPLNLEEQNTICSRGYPVYAQLCKEKEMPYPQLGPAGEIGLADERWWQQMQLTRKGMGRPTIG